MACCLPSRFTNLLVELNVYATTAYTIILLAIPARLLASLAEPKSMYMHMYHCTGLSFNRPLGKQSFLQSILDLISYSRFPFAQLANR